MFESVPSRAEIKPSSRTPAMAKATPRTSHERPSRPHCNPPGCLPGSFAFTNTTPMVSAAVMQTRGPHSEVVLSSNLSKRSDDLAEVENLLIS